MKKLVQHVLLTLCSVLLAADAGVARLDNIEKRIFDLVNQERMSRGMTALKWNSKLADAASGHLMRMVERRNLSHRFPGEPVLSDRLAAAGVRFNSSAENVAFATDWEDLHPSLMQSTGHRANILNPKYDEVGIAVAQGPNGYYVVQNFAHVTTESSSSDAEARFASALRRQLRRGRIEVLSSANVRKAVCDMADRDQVEARRLPADRPQQRMFAYTASEPEDIPDTLLDGDGMNGTRKVEVGICYRATEKYPGGIYWVGVIY